MEPDTTGIGERDNFILRGSSQRGGSVGFLIPILNVTFYLLHKSFCQSPPHFVVDAKDALYLSQAKRPDTKEDRPLIIS